jgi:hypothetical protein
VHFGSSNACLRFEKTDTGWRSTKEVDREARTLVMSRSVSELLGPAFADVPAKRVVADDSAPGELRDVKAAGYRNFLGMAGFHHAFHTPKDRLEITNAEILEPVARAFARAIELAVQSEPASR